MLCAWFWESSAERAMEPTWRTDMHHLYIRPRERLIQRIGSRDFPLPSERLCLCRVDIHHTGQMTLAALR